MIWRRLKTFRYLSSNALCLLSFFFHPTIMIATTDEINLQRLLINCENKLNNEQVDLWTGSEKRKYASVTEKKQMSNLAKRWMD